ncbi:hypothetical protein MHJ98_04865 [Corynebacterium afermentans]|uniref:hypothetical protein n=1 Tax=Corynebacterium afermentans TaxID=38286 RepID=UPI002573AF55|nr:hypothetical protein [Corynebacterium afermentans]MCG7291686.1 hypothetical protein [Corynebacterium afermentans]
MKVPKLVAAAAVAGLALSLTACSEDSDTTETTASSQAASSEAAPVAEMPTAEELNAVLQRAADPNLPIAERANTVQGGETTPELFDLMTQSQQESGANFQVVDPVLPGYTANSVLATVNFTRPNAESQLAEDVEFINEGGQWKISQSWACFLVSNTLAPEQVPDMCKTGAPAEAPAEQAPEEAPAEQAPAL